MVKILQSAASRSNSGKLYLPARRSHRGRKQTYLKCSLDKTTSSPTSHTRSPIAYLHRSRRSSHLTEEKVKHALCITSAMTACHQSNGRLGSYSSTSKASFNVEKGNTSIIWQFALSICSMTVHYVGALSHLTVGNEPTSPRDAIDT